MHPTGLFRPSRELVLVGLELVLELSHVVCIFIEEDLIRPQSFSRFPHIIPHHTNGSHRAVCGSEANESLIRLVEFLLGELLLVHLGDDIPRLDMLVPQQHDDPRRLRIESTGRVEDGILDDLLNAGVRDGGFVAEGIVSATVLDGFGERLGGCHPSVGGGVAIIGKG